MRTADTCIHIHLFSLRSQRCCDDSFKLQTLIGRLRRCFWQQSIHSCVSGVGFLSLTYKCPWVISSQKFQIELKDIWYVHISEGQILPLPEAFHALCCCTVHFKLPCLEIWWVVNAMCFLYSHMSCVNVQRQAENQKNLGTFWQHPSTLSLYLNVPPDRVWKGLNLFISPLCAFYCTPVFEGTNAFNLSSWNYKEQFVLTKKPFGFRETR